MSEIDSLADTAVSSMIEACSLGNISSVKSLLEKNRESTSFPASEQDKNSGMSPLMAAAKAGHLQVCEILLEEGAPWNAVDRKGMCAGNYATEFEHWDIVNLLVDIGTKSELILGAVARESMKGEKQAGTQRISQQETIPVEHEPCTKPDYLQRNVRYNESKTVLLDDDDDAVMMEWERPLMNAHASIITSNSQEGKIVLNVGFGMGIIDTALQKLKPKLHVIIEAHPLVHQKMLEDGWDKKDNVRICFGKWQDVMPKLIQEGIFFDGIFYDTYGKI
jgi:protein arginine N-methyltransferase 2